MFHMVDLCLDQFPENAPCISVTWTTQKRPVYSKWSLVLGPLCLFFFSFLTALLMCNGLKLHNFKYTIL